MKLALVSLVGMSLCTLIQVPPNARAAEAPADVCWSPGLGRIELRGTSERKLRLEIDGPTGKSQRELELASLPEGQRVIEAKVSGFTQSGLVLALTIEEGNQRSYRFALTRELAPGPVAETASSKPAGVTSWWLSQPIFSDAGAPYRIIDVHNPGGDTLEITFRRGFVQLEGSKVLSNTVSTTNYPLDRVPGGMPPSVAPLDELVFIDSCPLPGEVLQPGRAELWRVVASPR